MNDIIERKKILGDLLRTQDLAVLATQQGGQPYVSLVAFAATDDLENLIFATPRATRKYANLVAEPRVALMIDDRSNSEADFYEAVAATATGRAREVNAEDGEVFLRLYLAKHGSLRDFCAAPTTVMFVVEVEIYYMVSQFQNASELKMRMSSENA